MSEPTNNKRANNEPANEPAQKAPILIVEDDLGLAQVIQWTLEDAGFTIHRAGDGREALEWLAEHRPTLVVLDVGLPIIGGDGVAAGLRQIHGDDIPILIITADGRACEKAHRVGAFDYLHKPFDIDELLNVVERKLQEQ